MPALKVLAHAPSQAVRHCMDAVWDLHLSKPELLDKKTAKSGRWKVQNLLRIGEWVAILFQCGLLGCSQGGAA